MPVRLRITVLFAVLVMILLGLLCSSIYYFSYSARINAIKTRLTNRAITTASFLAQKEIFDQKLVQRIDSLTTIALKNKTVQAYDYRSEKIYTYSDVPGDTLQIDSDILDDARVNGSKYFLISDKEAVAYHYSNADARIVVISAAEDIDGKNNLRSLLNILLASFLIGTLFILITGYIFSSRLLRPINKISSDVAEISAQNLATRIDTGRTKDEWHKLATTFNELLDRLQESFELQRRFISNASHELSTPLTSISSQLEVSMQRTRQAEEYLQVMQSIYQDVRNMSKLTQTLLDFAKASGTPGGLEINLVRIDEVVLRLPSELSRMNSNYSVSIEFGAFPENEEKLLVFGNETLLLTALKNIAVNACKYSDDKHAHIKLEVKDIAFVVSISDKGRGIPEQELKNIFQPFYRVDENLANEGFGLGLSLTDRIIRLHKGSISVTSLINSGTTFTIHLPQASSLR